MKAKRAPALGHQRAQHGEAPNRIETPMVGSWFDRIFVGALHQSDRTTL